MNCHWNTINTSVNIFWVVQNNKPVIDAVNKPNKHKKATSVSAFDISTMYTKFQNNKFFMVFDSLINFCFDIEKVNILQLTVMGHVGKKYQR